MAVSAAIAAFRNPGAEFPGGLVSNPRRDYLNLLWSYYRNSAFESLSTWQQYREAFQLYRHIRSIYNPTKRLVNFYVAQVYPGVLSEDADRLPDGVPLAIPLAEDTDENLKIAIAQFWQWSNWQSNNKLMVRFGAATGSCLVEIIDNVEAGKVSAAVRWPGLIADKAKDGSASLVLDDVGNVKFYALEYDAVDALGSTFKYRKEVSQDSFRYFRDDAPFAPEGVGSEVVANPYGFVPAVWCKHVDEGDDFGSPAIAAAIGKIDELNGIASHTHDQIDILIDSPGIISTEGSVGQISQTSDELKTQRAADDEYAATSGLRSKPTKRLLMKAPQGAAWLPLTGNLQPEQVMPAIESLIMEIEHDFPELSMYTELRKMSEVTGPGAARMMGDVYSKVLEVSSNYDTQSIKLFQMALAIGGFRHAENRAGWRLRNDQQAKFAGFNLDSFRRGDLDFAINPRPLIPLTELDSIELAGKRLDNAKKAQGVLSEDRVLEIAGISDPAERKKEMGLLEKERQAEAELIASQAPANGGSRFIQ